MNQETNSVLTIISCTISSILACLIVRKITEPKLTIKFEKLTNDPKY